VVDGAALEKRCAKAPRVRIPPSPPQTVVSARPTPALARPRARSRTVGCAPIPYGERSPSGLWRRTGNAVRGNPSRVRIPPSPPPLALVAIAAAGGVGGCAPRSRTFKCARSGARRRLPICHARTELPTSTNAPALPLQWRAAVSFRSRARRGTSGALYLQSAPAGLNPLPRSPSSNAARRCDVEDRVPRSGEPRTVSGPEGSSTKRSSPSAAVRPGPSRPSWWARGRSGRRRVHGISTSHALDRRSR
jgi:hypothetical protein